MYDKAKREKVSFRIMTEKGDIREIIQTTRNQLKNGNFYENI